jgi:hypothetical protein
MITGGRILVFAAAAATIVATRAASAEETAPHVIGAGYKIGNGVGFMGADIVARLPHLSVDLQANYLSAGEPGGQTATGWAIAPTLDAQLRSVGHTPYIGVGLVYLHLSLEGVTATATGYLFNAGYEWRFDSGIGILVGGGFAYVPKVQATNGTTTISENIGFAPNLEAGVRYFF